MRAACQDASSTGTPQLVADLGDGHSSSFRSGACEHDERVKRVDPKVINAPPGRVFRVDSRRQQDRGMETVAALLVCNVPRCRPFRQEALG